MKYTFKNKEYDDIYSLGKDIYLNQTDFTKCLREDEDLLSFIKEADPNKLMRIQKLLKLSLPDEIISFRASMILNPYMEFRYKNNLFLTYKDIGTYFLISAPEANSLGMEIIHYNLISLHALFSQFTYCSIEEFKMIKEYENQAENSMIYAYFLLAYYLSKDTTLHYYKNEYIDIYSLLYYLRKENNSNNVSVLLSNRDFLKAFSKFSKDKKVIEEFLHYNSEYNKSKTKLDEFLKKRDQTMIDLSKIKEEIK